MRIKNPPTGDQQGALSTPGPAESLDQNLSKQTQGRQQRPKRVIKRGMEENIQNITTHALSSIVIILISYI